MSILVPPRRVLLRGSLLLYPSYVQDYLDRVRGFDGLGLQRAVTDGLNTYISGLFSAGLVGTSGGVISQAASVIKSHAILAGANTLPGCLVPVVGTAPISVNWVASDYRRGQGLGDTSNATKHLVLRSNTADPQDSQSIGFFMTSGTTGTMAVGGGPTTGQTAVFVSPTSTAATSPMRSRSGGGVTTTRGTAGVTGFVGLSRGTAANYITRFNNVEETITFTSQPPGVGNIFLFARNNTSNATIDSYANMRCMFYHVGENLNLAVLQSLQDQLFAALQAAIP